MLIRCPECGTSVSDKAESCVRCGCPLNAGPKKRQIVRCEKCGSVIEAGSAACPSCGGSSFAAVRTERSPAAVPKCPTCGSTDVEKISGVRKAAGLWALGLLSPSLGKQYRCKSCRYMW